MPENIFAGKKRSTREHPDCLNNWTVAAAAAEAHVKQVAVFMGNLKDALRTKGPIPEAALGQVNDDWTKVHASFGIFTKACIEMANTCLE